MQLSHPGPRRAVHIPPGAYVVLFAALALGWLSPDAAAQDDPAPTWCEQHYSTLGGPLGTLDLPWEVTSPRGEGYVPDVFYAEPIQNRQLMPTELELPASKGEGAVRYRVHHLIYPTLGNPNLVSMSDSDDALMVVLRLAPEVVARLGAVEKMRGAQTRLLRPGPGYQTQLRLYLVPRAARGDAERPAALSAGSQALPLSLTCAMTRPNTGDMPEVLKQRQTVMLAFDTKALSAARPGLYDLRLELGVPGAPGYDYELQYNAVRLFASEPQDGFTVINVADSQTSVSDVLDGIPGEVSFRTLSLRRLEAFVADLGTRDDPWVRKAAFITFNGDLHNGGSPASLLPETVASTYREEAQAIVTLLRQLPLPIFLTAGNHDGYASTGKVPETIERTTQPRTFFGRLLARLKSWRTRLTTLGRALPLREVLLQSDYLEQWPGFDLNRYLYSYLERIEHTPGGWARDVFTGVFSRWDGAWLQRWEGWRRVPDAELNPMLYDGFNQWRRTYGPLYFSHIWGDNHFISLNTFDLRQHRRTGWGMYTVNYGGGLSPVQSAWLHKQVNRSQAKGKEVVLLAHHDPRGGHMGEDFPYYFEQVDYRGMTASTLAFLRGEVLSPVVCAQVEGWPDGLLPASVVNRCLHDGLQEWMRPDPVFDCATEDRDEASGQCRPEVYDLTSPEQRHPVFSGFQLIDLLAERKQIRTLLLGHTHYNSVEILQPGDALVPGEITFEPSAALEYLNQADADVDELTLAELEVLNPLRRGVEDSRVDAQELVAQGRRARLSLDLAAAGHGFGRVLKGHELVVLRMTTVADLSSQLVDGWAMSGYATLQFGADSGAAQLGAVRYYQWSPLSQSFRDLGTLALDRGARWPAMEFSDRLRSEQP